MSNEEGKYKIILENIAKLISIKGKGEKKIVEIEGRKYEVTVENVGEGKYNVNVNGEEYTVTIDKERKLFIIDGTPYNANIVRVPAKKKYAPLKPKRFDKTEPSRRNIIAPITGKIVEILVKEGEKVNKGDPVIVIESMKIRNMINSGRKGKVERINVKIGQTVVKGEVLIELD
ncbi:MAG: biotin/lipoyl-containing protein [Candidatus Njordarchaeia archaeon]